MMFIWIYCALISVWFSTLPAYSIQDVAFFPAANEYSADDEFITVLKTCDDEKVTEWTRGFLDCFMKKKYDDGGRNLEYIVDRILEHAEACVETSNKDCRPDFEGFKKVLNTVLEQMKDYSFMYLQEIHSGRDKIKDLECVEEILSLDVYNKCFSELPVALNKTDYEIQSSVRKGIKCTNQENIDCSKEARTSLNRIVRIIVGMEQPPEEDSMEEKPTPPPPMKWYDYVAQPFVTAWEAVKNFFSGVFG